MDPCLLVLDPKWSQSPGPWCAEPGWRWPRATRSRARPRPDSGSRGQCRRRRRRRGGRAVRPAAGVLRPGRRCAVPRPARGRAHGRLQRQRRRAGGCRSRPGAHIRRDGSRARSGGRMGRRAPRARPAGLGRTALRRPDAGRARHRDHRRIDGGDRAQPRAAGARRSGLARARAGGGDTAEPTRTGGRARRDRRPRRRGALHGRVAVAIVAAAAIDGGELSEADLAAHRTPQPDPLVADFEGARITVQPPISQALLAPLALRTLERSGARDLLQRRHAAVEAMEAAFGVRDEIADPSRARGSSSSTRRSTSSEPHAAAAPSSPRTRRPSRWPTTRGRSCRC